VTHETEHKSFIEPDETRVFSNGRAEILSIGGGDAWVLGEEPVVVVDWYGASNYAKAP
jgi:hypothetical protein